MGGEGHKNEDMGPSNLQNIFSDKSLFPDKSIKKSTVELSMQLPILRL